MAKITIFGLAGTGTTTIGRLLARNLGYEFHSTGNLFRKKAAELGLDLYAFEQKCNQDPRYDRELDQEIAALGRNTNNFVLESRLGWYFVPDSFKVKVVCDEDVRLLRVSVRDRIPLEEARAKTLFREASGVERYRENYGIQDLGDDGHFDMVIDSTHRHPKDIVMRIRGALA